MLKRLIIFGIFIYTVSPVFAVLPPEEDVSKARLLYSQNRWIQMHYFLQAGHQTNFNKDNSEGDFYLNHNRLIFNGQTAEQFYFFMQTDDITTENINSNGANKVFTQDAYLHYKPMDEIQVYAGLMPVPINRQNLTTPATTLATSLNHNTIPLFGYSNNGRDTGLMLRGFLFSKYFEYRFGVFEGLGREEGVYDQGTPETEDDVAYERNEGDFPRFTTRLQFHIIDKEEGMFYSENYLGKRNVFAIGLGFDFQPSVSDKHEKDNFENYFAISADTNIQVATGAGNAVAIEGGFIYSHNNPGIKNEVEELNYNDLVNFYLQGGLLLVDKYQPYARLSFTNNFTAKDGDDYSENTFSIGGNYFFDSHHANARIQYDMPFGDNKDTDNEHRIITQAQIYL